MINSVKLTNFLSFGENSQEIELRPLNVIIGANGSGKSNLLEAFELLRAAPSDITRPISEGGGTSEWIFKGNGADRASIDINTTCTETFQYSLSFEQFYQRFRIHDEKLIGKNGSDFFTFQDQSTRSTTISMLAVKGLDFDASILADEFSQIHIYRDWTFGRNAPVRQPQRAELPSSYLDPSFENLCLVLNRMGRDLTVKKRIISELQNFYEGVEDYGFDIIGNYLQLFFQEKGMRSPVSAARLSDGTLRYLCLLAILCNPTPPPLVCIEEPELGLHPDILPSLAKLLEEASERCQLVVTTHSEMLVDAFTHNPEVVLVAEKHEGETQLERLKAKQLKVWLEEYKSLGSLWSSGHLGGNRW